jgi:hypothetical protein
MEEYTELDLKNARHLLRRYDFVQINSNGPQELFRHIDGHEVRFELSNRFPFDVRWDGEGWCLEFSLNGLIVELEQGFDRIEEAQCGA